MPAYVIALIEAVTDAETYRTYVGQVEPTFAPFGGRFLARKPGPERLEGDYAPARAIILEFPGEAEARAWHASPAYQPVMKLRQSASRGSLLLVPPYPAAAHPRVGEVCYVEVVTDDVAGVVRVCQDAHGWAFDPPEEHLGSARVASLPGGARFAVRAPLHPQEEPLTRAYVRVADVDAAAARAGRAGARVLLPPTAVGPFGTIAIWDAGGVEHGAWELPEPVPAPASAPARPGPP